MKILEKKKASASARKKKTTNRERKNFEAQLQNGIDDNGQITYYGKDKGVYRVSPFIFANQTSSLYFVAVVAVAVAVDVVEDWLWSGIAMAPIHHP